MDAKRDEAMAIADDWRASPTWAEPRNNKAIIGLTE